MDMGMVELHRAREFVIEDYLRLGQALGAVHGQNSLIIAARDGIHVSRLAKRAVVVGIAAAGASVLDFRLIPDLLVGFSVGRGHGDAGIHVRYDGGGLGVRFLARRDPEGTARRVMESFRAGAFPHVPLSSLGEVTLYPNAIEDFVRDMHKKVNFLKGHRLLVDCRNTPMAVLAPPLLESYGMKVSLFNDAVSTYQEPKGEESFLRRLSEGDFTHGVRLLERGAALYPRSGHREDFGDLTELLVRMGQG